MGNVFASSMPPPSVTPGQTGIIPDPKQLSETNNLKNNNPGSMEELHRKCKDVFPMTFDGSKIVVNKMLSNHFQISHNIIMSSGTIQPPGYRFGATYIGTKQISPSEAFPIFFGEIDPNGNLNSRIIHLLGERVRLNIAAQFQNSKCVASQLITDYLAPNYTASMALSNIDPVRNSGLTVVSYLQNVTNKLSMGAEMVCQYNSNVAHSILSVAGRYTSPENYIVSGTINNNSVQLCYYQKKNEYLQVGVQVETNLTEPDSTASFGYQIDLPKSNFVFRGLVDTNWNVGCVFEKKLLPLPFTLMFSGMINHVKAQTRVGLGLYVG
ncbi:mitochondrial import receptor subunit TOM40-like protein [Euroglyphus maynei]|uniref:Mitochondrial import receptor subunit TOM40-like protein n=1 Tax=Euroglyphus maynei TaxID=6958 RepID=A0A1Y3BJE6_EURMA|nr:mitochondrial import receptor subunit TOM40-like protein [Euroglyphus maynei]